MKVFWESLHVDNASADGLDDLAHPEYQIGSRKGAVGNRERQPRALIEAPREVGLDAVLSR